MHFRSSHTKSRKVKAFAILFVLLGSIFSGLHHFEHDDADEFADCSLCCVLHSSEENASAVLVAFEPEEFIYFTFPKDQPTIDNQIHAFGYFEYSLYNRPPPIFV